MTDILEEPPWGGLNTPFRPERIPALDPAEFRESILACLPQEWPAEYPLHWAAPLVVAFTDRLDKLAGLDVRKWSPLYYRFMALLSLLERGELGKGWPSQEHLLTQVEAKIHPALLHTAAQLPLLPDGHFEPVEFRRAAVRAAKAMGMALPPGI